MRNVSAKVRFISFEPLLDDVSDVDLTGIHWAIVGGESGAQARPFDLDWARGIKRLCKKSSARFYFKQLGYRPQQDGVAFPLSQRKQTGSKDTHGVLLENFPTDLREQKWPK